MNRDFIEALFATIDRRDWPALRDRFCVDGVYERPGYDPIVGLENILDFYANVRVIACGKHQLERIVIENGAGACWGRFVGTHKNGTALDVRFADVYTFEDEKVKTRRSYFFRPAV